MSTPLPLMVFAARRAAAHPEFLASRLGPDVEATAARLGYTVRTAVSVYLCRTPTGRADVDRIAGVFGLDAGRLAEVCGM